MLNRRKHSWDTDGPVSDERVALIGATSSADSPTFDMSSNTLDDRLPFPNVNVTVPILPRKTSSKSLYANTHKQKHNVQQSNYLIADHSEQQQPFWQSSIGHQYHGDSYELTRLHSSSQNRAVISLTGNDSYYKHSSTDFILYTIQPGDTLQNLSVKYSCPIASIKRLNNLWSDRDFYGLSKIKLPVGKFRLLADAISEASNSAGHINDSQSVRLDNNNLGHSSNSSQLQDQTKTHIPQKLDTVAHFNEDQSTGTLLRADTLFKNLDQHIEKAREAAKSYNDNAEDIMQTLAQSGNLVGDDTDQEVERLPDLSDFGLSYNFLILFIFIVCLVCPLAYVIYHEETHRDTHHHDNHHGLQDRSKTIH